MAFTSELPKWDNPGTKPSDAKIVEGYLFNDHPPANWWNYQMNRTYLALKELQEKSAEKTKATTSADGLMSKEDKSKLDGVAAGANNYTHPATHPASMITESTTKRFVADTEKTAWNAKETPSGAQSKADAAAATVQTNLNTHTANGTMHVTTSERNEWNAKETPSGALAKANTAETNAINAFKGFGLGKEVKNLGTIDYNSLDLETGFYFAASDSLNAPSANSFTFIFEKYSTVTGHIIAISHQTTPVLFLRRRTSGTWGNWIEQESASGAQTKANAVQTNLTTHTNNDVMHITSTERNTWNAKETPEGAQAKANAAADEAEANALYTLNQHIADAVKHITAAERTTWNAKASTAIANGTTNGLMSAADFNKLANVASNANNYVHPSSHPATMITEDSTHRFATDAEKTSWNAKETTAGAQAKVDAALPIYGTNTNGNYTRFPDGTMIMTHNFTANGNDGTYYDGDRSFPYPFTEVGAVQVTAYSQFAGSTKNGVAETFGTPLTLTTYRWGANFPWSSIPTTGSYRVQIMAVGKWK